MLVTCNPLHLNGGGHGAIATQGRELEQDSALGIPAERRLLGTTRHCGKLVQWTGQTGWIEPAQPLDHPLADVQGGRYYLAWQGDVVASARDKLSPGDDVTFFPYADPEVLGAMDVRPAPGDKAASSADGARHGSRGPYDYSSRGGTVTLPTRPGRQLRRPPPEVHPEEAIGRAQHAMYSSIWESSRAVMHLETTWSHDELTKRVAKYFSKAAQAPELQAVPWEIAARQFIDHAMQCYSAACGATAWFFELDLAPAISAGLWELSRVPNSSGAPPCNSYAALEKLATAHYEDVMDALLLEKAMWDATRATFADEVICGKVYKLLYQTHEAALAAATTGATKRMAPLERVEHFLKDWMEASMSRAWQAVESSGMTITEGLVLSLFQNLVAPFGEDHPFSCVPTKLTESIGRPPHDWPYLRRTAHSLCEQWRNPSTSSSKKRRKASAGVG